MYHASSRLPHPLSPAAYFDPAQFAREREKVFRGNWHFVGSTQDLPEPGMFFTRNILGTPLIVRNFDGQIFVLSNVCAHRHSLIRPEACGKMQTLRCRYHGWEYQADGQTARIPGAQNFRPLSGARPSIKRYRSELCGALIFVALEDDAPPLAEFLGELHALCLKRFGADWKQSLVLDSELPANWKVPVEITLESYHIPMVHPDTFAEDPGDEGSEHVLRSGWSGFRAGTFSTRWRDILKEKVEMAIQAERLLMRKMDRPPQSFYRHVHVFPNLMFSFTDTISLLQVVEPVSPVTSRAIVRQFGLFPRTAPRWWRPGLELWNRIQASVTRKILREDFAAYAGIQAGLSHSTQAGMLGRCEERIYMFQNWIIDRAGGTPHGEDRGPGVVLDSDKIARDFIG